MGWVREVAEAGMRTGTCGPFDIEGCSGANGLFKVFKYNQDITVISTHTYKFGRLIFTIHEAINMDTLPRVIANRQS